MISNDIVSRVLKAGIVILSLMIAVDVIFMSLLIYVCATADCTDVSLLVKGWLG